MPYHSSHASSPYSHPHAAHSSLNQHSHGHSIGPTRTPSLSYPSSHPYGGGSGNLSGVGSGFSPSGSIGGLSGVAGISGLQAPSTGANGLGMNGMGYPTQVRSVQSSTALYQQQYRQSMGIGANSLSPNGGMNLGEMGIGGGMGYNVNSRRASMPTLHHSHHTSSSMIPTTFSASPTNNYSHHPTSAVVPSSSISPGGMGNGLQLYHPHSSGGRGLGQYTPPQPSRGYVFPGPPSDNGNGPSIGGA